MLGIMIASSPGLVMLRTPMRAQPLVHPVMRMPSGLPQPAMAAILAAAVRAAEWERAALAAQTEGSELAFDVWSDQFSVPKETEASDEEPEDEEDEEE